MKIAVTGAAGFIGSHVCEALLAGGHEIVGIDCFTDQYPRSQKEGNLFKLLTMERFTFHETDLRVDPLEPILEGASAVINEAAMTGLALSWESPSAYAECNFLAVKRLADACRNVKIERFVQASTSSVYGLNAVGRESVPLRPTSPYGITKLAGELLLIAYFDAFAFPVVVLRYFSVYGPRQRPDMAYHRIIERLAAHEEIVIYGDGHQSRSNTYIADCVKATLLGLYSGEPGEIYNIGGGTTIELLDAVDVIADEMGVTPKIQFEPVRLGDQRHTSANIDKARSVLGYSPETEPLVGLRRQVEWQIRNRHC